MASASGAGVDSCTAGSVVSLGAPGTSMPAICSATSSCSHRSPFAVEFVTFLGLGLAASILASLASAVRPQRMHAAQKAGQHASTITLYTESTKRRTGRTQQTKRKTMTASVTNGR